MVERTKKKNGKAIIDPKTKKPVKILVDAYAKTIKFTRLDMSKLQDYAAEATGLERGISSDRIHEEARQYKAREQAREIERMAKEIESQKSQLMTQEKELANQKALLANQVSSIERHSAIIEKQANTIISQRIFIENQEKVMRDSVCEMQKQGKEVVTNFDEQTSKIRSIGLTIDRGLMERRNWLDRTSKENYAEAPSSKIIQILQPLANAITVVAMGAAAMASTIANTLAKTVKEKEKMLFAITRQIKEQSIWKSTKGAILSLIDMPANKQVKELMSEVESVKAEAEKKAQIVNELEIKLSSLNEENQRKSSAINKFTSSIERNAIEKQTLQNRINELQRTLRDKEETIRCWNKDFVSIAEDLVEHAGPKLMERYEARGLHKYIGENLWQRAKEAKELRREEREEQAESKGRSYGLHL